MRLPFLLRLAFVLYVAAEIALVVLAVRWLGGWVTFLLMVATSLLGGWLLRSEGARVFQAVREAAREGGAPARAVGDTRVVMAGGVLLVLPGFLTDLAGLVVLAPPARPLARRVLGRAPLTARGRGHQAQGPVIRGEVVDPGDDPTRPPG
jgi:UPF0716 protein FxsA